MKRNILIIFLITAVFCLSAHAGPSLGLADDIVSENNTPGSFPFVHDNNAAPLYLDENEWPGVIRAARDMQTDIEHVTGTRPSWETENRKLQTANATAPAIVIIGTLGKSAFIETLVKAGKLDVSTIAGKWESFIITTVANPLPGIDQALVIAGSDKRGTIYGLYEISEQSGVSPWYWWADVPIKKHEKLYVSSGLHTQGPPAVKYRGIFINDEEPAFGSWAREKFGGINSKMYAHLFELILRLRGNYLWPAMWGKAFAEDDPESPRLADEYGIIMGSSHHEPMMRAHAEWTRHKAAYGNGEWNYATNGDALKKFFREGIERNKNYEKIVTIGMRGDGDEAMVKGGDMATNIALLERIVREQRAILAETAKPGAPKDPQMWALYKEVSDYYDSGMKVPDDVTLLWCDDNWGNNRRLPTVEERKRSGGAGIYYHFDYVGGPRSYKWINTNPLPKIWEQMTTAYEYGADRIWIVNVGDLKPLELPTEFFLRLAWNPRAITKEKVADFARRWAEREFGPTYADDIADIVSKYAKYNAWRKPELLEPTTFSYVNYDEDERVYKAWREIVTKAEKINSQLFPEARSAFFQLVLYPTKASATVVHLHLATGINQLYAKQARADTNRIAQLARDLFKEDQELTDAYHQLNGGKWNHMMAQTHIGYTSWRDPEKNIMPELTELEVPNTASMGVWVEGSEATWPDAELTLPPFDSINRQSYRVEIFNHGSVYFDYKVSATVPWIKANRRPDLVNRGGFFTASIDWDNVPIGTHQAYINVTRKDAGRARIRVVVVNSDTYTPQNTKAFGGLIGPIAINAADATRNNATADARWEAIPDYGRGPSGMAIFPVTAPSAQPPANSPCLEYAVLIAKAGETRVDLITGPTLDIQPGRGVRIAVSFDDQKPQILDAFATQTFSEPGKRADMSAPAIRDWPNWVKDNARTMRSTHTITAPGIHTLKIWMVDPGVVLEKIIINADEARPSYFGPLAN